MIDELLVRNIALISDAQISFAPGLTALTGETGAGKTALLSALKLLMGERADSSCVREGETGALVQGRLYRSDADAEGFAPWQAFRSLHRGCVHSSIYAVSMNISICLTPHIT